MDLLRDRVAIITGGGTGIGRGIALALSKEGSRVIVCGRRIEPLQEVVSEIEKNGGKGSFIQTDVSNQAEVDNLVHKVLEDFRTVDILVNNAGTSGSGYIHKMEVAAWDRVFSVNLRGPFLMTRAVLPIMREKRWGHIINISSESGLNYYQGDGAYGLSKHALNDFGEYVQRENQDFNIRVNTICPGMVWTPMSDDEPDLDQDKCLYPEDIADLALWLLKRRPNIKIGAPILIQTMLNPWE